mgnify:CR=1 FL=1
MDVLLIGLGALGCLAIGFAAGMQWHNIRDAWNDPSVR